MSKKAFSLNRRDYLKTMALSGAALTFFPFPGFASKSVQKTQKVYLGFIGTGNRGRTHLRNILNLGGVVVPAICDIDPEAITKAQQLITKAGQKPAKVYTGDDHAFLKLLERNDIEGVIISTPWNWHTPMSVAAMEAGKYVGVEVSAATTMPECWDLVDTYEKTGVPLMILENVCYSRNVMAVLNMVRQQVFGELLFARCGYRHDLRKAKMYPGVTMGKGAIGEARWRGFHSLHRNADLYPTHGVGPVATMMNINRGNRFLYLTSHATKSRGLHRYIINNPEGGPDHPNARLDWKLGDVVTTVINTSNGETIVVTHDTNSPRPYSLDFEVQGTKGIIDFDYPNQRIYIEGESPGEAWEKPDKWLEKYDHPLWKKYADFANGSGHGGMDFFVDHAFVEIVKRKLEAPLDVYDAAAWSAITPLSERSLAEGSAPQYFPDFTRGRWINRNPVFALDDDF